MLRGSYSQTFKLNVNCFDAATPKRCMIPQFLTTPRLLQEWCEWYAKWCNHRRTLQHSAKNIIILCSQALHKLSHLNINCFDAATLSIPRDWKRFTYGTLRIWSYCKSRYSKHTNGPPHNHTTTLSQVVCTSTLHSPGKTPTKYRIVSSCQAGYRILDIHSEMGTHITNSCNQSQSGDNVRETLGLPHCHF